MRLRCIDPKHKAYPNYGGRGITVCDRWMDDPQAFVDDMGLKPSRKHEIDRIDNNRGYFPDNCRWATRSENTRNRRSNRVLDAFGRSMTLVEWSQATGIGPDTITKRLDAGWSVEDALTKQARAKAKNGEAKPVKHKCADCDALVWGLRCRPCENKKRAAARIIEAVRAAA